MQREDPHNIQGVPDEDVEADTVSGGPPEPSEPDDDFRTVDGAAHDED